MAYKTEVQRNLENFFEEKNLPYESWDIIHDGTSHFIDTDFVIELILKSTGTEQQKKIRNQITKIDFMNGNVNHYLKFLAENYVKTCF